MSRGSRAPPKTLDQPQTPNESPSLRQISATISGRLALNRVTREPGCRSGFRFCSVPPTLVLGTEREIRARRARCFFWRGRSEVSMGLKGNPKGEPPFWGVP